MNTDHAKKGKQTTKEDGLDSEVNQLENMWDEILSRGDDDFHEAFRQHQSRDNKDEKSSVTHRTRKRGKGI